LPKSPPPVTVTRADLSGRQGDPESFEALAAALKALGVKRERGSAEAQDYREFGRWRRLVFWQSWGAIAYFDDWQDERHLFVATKGTLDHLTGALDEGFEARDLAAEFPVVADVCDYFGGIDHRVRGLDEAENAPRPSEAREGPRGDDPPLDIPEDDEGRPAPSEDPSRADHDEPDTPTDEDGDEPEPEELMTKEERPPCLGWYEDGEAECDGSDEDPNPCSWRARCQAVQTAAGDEDPTAFAASLTDDEVADLAEAEDPEAASEDPDDEGGDEVDDDLAQLEQELDGLDPEDDDPEASEDDDPEASEDDDPEASEDDGDEDDGDEDDGDEDDGDEASEDDGDEASEDDGDEDDGDEDEAAPGADLPDPDDLDLDPDDEDLDRTWEAESREFVDRYADLRPIGNLVINLVGRALDKTIRGSAEAADAGDLYVVDKTPPNGSSDYLTLYHKRAEGWDKVAVQIRYRLRAGGRVDVRFDTPDADEVRANVPEDLPVDGIVDMREWSVARDVRAEDAPAIARAVVALIKAGSLVI